MWLPLHRLQRRQVRRPVGSLRRCSNILSGVHRSRRAPTCWCSYWSGDDERGIELLQHWVDPHGRLHDRAQLHHQQIWLGGAMCRSRGSGIVSIGIPRRLPPSPSASSLDSTGAPLRHLAQPHLSSVDCSRARDGRPVVCRHKLSAVVGRHPSPPSLQ
jgi:hypothetical protein